MPDFLNLLKQQQNVTPNKSGSTAAPPNFNENIGAWTAPTKATHALLLVEESAEGDLVCEIPSHPEDRFRLGQINFSSLRPAAVVTFRLWCAAKVHNEKSWHLLPEIYWFLVFRLYSKDVTNIKNAFEGHSQSGIEFQFEPADGSLAVYTQRQIIRCHYLEAGLLLNYPDEQPSGFKHYGYREITNAIQQFIQIQPLARVAVNEAG